MAEPLQNLSLDQLKTLLKRSFLQQPLGRIGEEAYRRSGGEVSPYQAIAGRSSSLDYARQLLPENLDNTNWYQKLKNQLPDGDLQSTPGVRRRVANQIGQVPLGGLDTRELERMQRDRSFIERGSENPSLEKRLKYLDASKYTTEAGQDISLKGRPAARAAQATGVLARDVMTDGARNIWWFLNAPQAATQAAALQGIHKTGLKHTSRPMIGNAALRLAATAPAVAAMSTAIGNIGRPAGYKAILPSEEDPRKTDSPVGELLSRYFLGRTGRLLPYDEFAKERPDVDKGEYMRYKAYQFNKDVDLNPLDGDFNVLGALRGTTDGIHGPEINFMGKAIPVLTGILPTAAAIAGIRRGVNTAGIRLAGNIEEVNLLNDYLTKKRKKPLSSYSKDRTKAAIQEAQEEIDIETFKDALKYGAGYTTAAALTGQALESIRRDMGRED
tara:strand:+ start:4672 stop:5997 length:1326 start_codon:yes stop_codon:yes gene_type:complete